MALESAPWRGEAARPRQPVGWPTSRCTSARCTRCADFVFAAVAAPNSLIDAHGRAAPPCGAGLAYGSTYPRRDLAIAPLGSFPTSWHPCW